MPVNSRPKQTDEQFDAMMTLARASGAYKKARQSQVGRGVGAGVDVQVAADALMRARNAAAALGCDVSGYAQERFDAMPLPKAVKLKRRSL